MRSGMITVGTTERDRAGDGEIFGVAMIAVVGVARELLVEHLVLVLEQQASGLLVLPSFWFAEINNKVIGSA